MTNQELYNKKMKELVEKCNDCKERKADGQLFDLYDDGVIVCAGCASVRRTITENIELRSERFKKNATR